MACCLSVCVYMLGDRKMSETKIKRTAKAWLNNHDRCATHIKFWWNAFAGCYKFQACIEQEPYGDIFSITTSGKIFE